MRRFLLLFLGMRVGDSEKFTFLVESDEPLVEDDISDEVDGA